MSMQQARHDELLPEGILDIIDIEVLTSFLRGFNNLTFAGVALYYPVCKGPPAVADDILCIDPTRTEQERHYHPFCRCYRVDCGRDCVCIAFDKMIVLKYYGGVVSEPMLYRCHREIWDMAYPLKVDGRLFGVLFAGQAILKKWTRSTVWKRALASIYTDVNWSFAKSNPSHGDQHNDIALSLEDDSELTPEQRKLLLNTIDEENKANGANITIPEIMKRYKDFVAFGRVTTGLLNQLYQARSDAMQLRDSEARLKDQRDHDRFHNRLLSELFEARPEHLLSWQSHLKRCFSELVKFYSIERVGIFHGHRANSKHNNVSYDLIAMNSSKWWDTSAFSLPKDELPAQPCVFSPGHLPPALQYGVGQKLSDSKYFYVYPYAYEHSHVYTLVVVQTSTSPPEDVRCHLNSVFERICKRDEVVRLSLRLRGNYDDFSQHVIQVRHDLNTSVQAITGNIEKFYLMLGRGLRADDGACSKQYDLIWDAVESHVVRIRALNSDVDDRHAKIESVNLVEAVLKQVALYEATAQKKGVQLIVDSPEASCDAYVVCEPSELQRAVAALLDNAIKYSFDDKDIYVTCTSKDREFSLSVENYGIGIPPQQLAKIRDKQFMRGRVKDFYRIREGTGMGLHIASQVFVDMLKGRVHITSEPDPNIKRARDQYLRYVTTVRCFIPVDM